MEWFESTRLNVFSLKITIIDQNSCLFEHQTATSTQFVVEVAASNANPSFGYFFQLGNLNEINLYAHFMENCPVGAGLSLGENEKRVFLGPLVDYVKSESDQASGKIGCSNVSGVEP